ncbi:dsDNA nuclease domain-containing protein [Mesorhizobium sp. f-mel]
MSVKDSLLTVSQREEGGRTAYDRFDYQTAWGLSRLLDLHAEGKNYAVAFEFHDDIVSLDEADAPTSAIFYQVKTKKSGNWSFAQITSRPTSKGAKKSSFAGKMFDNFVRFGAIVEKLAFVSNQPLPDVIVVHGEEGFTKAEKKKLAKFVTELSSESAGFKDLKHTSLFFFVFSDLNLSNYENTVVGRIAAFLEQELGSHIPPKPFALALNDYCRRRSKSLADLSSFDQLKASKFVTRADMLKWLSQAQDQHERRPDWTAVANELHLPLAEKTRIERAWREYEITLRSRSNAATIAFTERVRGIVDEAIDKADDLLALINAVITEVRPIVTEWKAGTNDAFVKAAILYELKR